MISAATCISPTFWHLHAYCAYHVPIYIPRAVASYLAAGRAQQQGEFRACSPRKVLLRPFFAKIGTTTTHELDFRTSPACRLSTLRRHQFCSYIQVTVWKTTTIACIQVTAKLLGSWRQLREAQVDGLQNLLKIRAIYTKLISCWIGYTVKPDLMNTADA